MGKKHEVSSQVSLLHEKILSIHQRLDSHKHKSNEIKDKTYKNEIDIVHLKNNIKDLESRTVCVDTINTLVMSIESLQKDIEAFQKITDVIAVKQEELEKMVTKSSFITNAMERVFWIFITAALGALSIFKYVK